MYDGELYFGGNISAAGGKPSLFIARWQDPQPTDVASFDRSSLSVEFLPPRPNPFSVRATFDFRLEERMDVDLGIYDLAGRLVNTLVSGSHEPGVHRVKWSGTDHLGARVSGGVYFARLTANGTIRIKKIVRTK